MKNISVLLILSLLLPNFAYAETVYLNDGTVLIGETQSTSESSIVVKTSQGDIPVLKVQFQRLTTNPLSQQIQPIRNPNK